MNAIDPARHPRLHHAEQGAHWAGQDDFPACEEWADEVETWLAFADNAGELGRYLPRLRGPRQQRDETLMELAAGHFLQSTCGHPVIGWEPNVVGGTLGEYLITIAPGSTPAFVEVKSPGWEQEIAKAEGQTSPRLRRPKYLHNEVLSTAPWSSVRHAVKKAYPKLPDSMPTLLVVCDDLRVPLNKWLINVDIALYCPRGAGTHPPDTYLAEDGCFVDARHERLGAVGILNVELPLGRGIQYRFSLFDNPRALPAVAIPPGAFVGHPRFDGSTPAK